MPLFGEGGEGLVFFSSFCWLEKEMKFQLFSSRAGAWPILMSNLLGV